MEDGQDRKVWLRIVDAAIVIDGDHGGGGVEGDMTPTCEIRSPPLAIINCVQNQKKRQRERERARKREGDGERDR